MPEILDFDELRRVSRLGPRARLARMERWARGNGIRYKYDGKGGIWTTQAAMDAAVGISGTAGPDSGAMITADQVSFG